MRPIFFFAPVLAIFTFCLAIPTQAAEAEKAAEAKAVEEKAVKEKAPAEKTEQPAVPTEPLPIKGSKKTVMFPHDKGHEKIECVVCHHKVDDKQTFAKCSDAGCHDNLVAKKGVESLYYVMHSKSAELKHQTCMSCHTKVVAEKPDLKKALTGCHESKCHPEAKKKKDKAKSKDEAAPKEEAAPAEAKS